MDFDLSSKINTLKFGFKIIDSSEELCLNNLFAKSWKEVITEILFLKNFHLYNS